MNSQQEGAGSAVIFNLLDYFFGINRSDKQCSKSKPVSIRDLNRLTNCRYQLAIATDSRLPCITFYKQLMGVTGRGATCRRQNCEYAHFDTPDRMTSLMEVFALVSRAQRRIDLAMYLITHEWLKNMLIYLHNKGVRVRVITDKGGDVSRRKNDRSDELQKSGIRVKANNSNGSLMHNKFVIVDDAKLILGSFNWTNNAILKNDEAIIINSQITTVCKFSEKFEQLWRSFGDRVDPEASPIYRRPEGTPNELTTDSSCRII